MRRWISSTPRRRRRPPVALCDASSLRPGLEPAVRTRRLAGMLARKGYGPGLAFRVIREVLEDEGAETSPFAEDPGYPLD